MNGETRRQQILDMLSAKTPVTGTSLGEEFDVSRQVIVQDIALLRAQGYDIIATPQGYLQKYQEKSGQYIITVASRHNREEIREELETIVDLGGKVLDVVVEHPIYGELTGHLMIKSRRDVKLFMDKLKNTNANPLAVLTDGIHIHHIEAPNQQVATEIKHALQENDFLVNEEG